MSEKKHYGKENYLTHEEIHIAPELVINSGDTVKKAETVNDDQEHTINIEKVREKLLEQPDIPLELPYDETLEGNQPQYIDRKIKSKTLKNELEVIRSDLPFAQKILSKVIHQPIISKISSAGARTIARPSGLLGGGILAFCGSLTYLLFTKYVGMKYNYFIFILLFLFGFLASVTSELLVKTFRRQK